ncbi:uncharacterized protein LOC112041849 [Lingula anatina]|uniref:Uncharacterized protein LOC112041849 n=1 Tax=Lingula anatina TaxID=7574 RepID=A0A2R2MMQ5_LINAN|nr:uncharacterized protein LOC112041849 [Lingula anatina]|eukprot:XP_023931337.1 uncharacterized protein LOC112041849 [Lingula anatina]
MTVCFLHFREEDYISTLVHERKRLKPGTIPSIFPFNKVKDVPSSRTSRLAKRRKVGLSDPVTVPTAPDYIHEVEVESQADEAVEDKHEDCPGVSRKESTSSQCDIITPSDTRESIMLYQQMTSCKRINLFMYL